MYIHVVLEWGCEEYFAMLTHELIICIFEMMEDKQIIVLSLCIVFQNEENCLHSTFFSFLNFLEYNLPVCSFRCFQ